MIYLFPQLMKFPMGLFSNLVVWEKTREYYFSEKSGSELHLRFRFT